MAISHKGSGASEATGAHDRKADSEGGEATERNRVLFPARERTALTALERPQVATRARRCTCYVNHSVNTVTFPCELFSSAEEDDAGQLPLC